MVLDPLLIPGFEITGRLASGGVAEVFRALRQSDGLEVALKITSLADMDPDFHAGERFRREGELLARLDHPSLPRVFGAGVTQGELGWLALELVRGEPLGSRARRPAAELIPIFIQVAEGLQAVAQEGIVHRDVSPDNILVEERRGRARARLIDFGIAKDLLGGGDLTRVGAFLGKLQYASPEQLLGPPPGETLDFRSDIYSLGLTFYEVLSGDRAITAEELPEIVEAHLRGAFPPLALPPGQPPAPRLIALVNRMMKGKREERPQSWEEVLADLWRSREEVSPLAETLVRKGARPVSSAVKTVTLPPEVASRLKRELLFGRLVLVAGALALAAALGFTVWLLRRRPPSDGAAALAAATPIPGSEHPAPTAAVPAPTLPSPRRTPRPAATRTPRPSVTHVPHPSAAARLTPVFGTLDVALVPSGSLDDVRDESGKIVAPGRPLPARVALPPGRYTLKLTARGLDCAKSVTVTLRAGKTTTVRETCIEVK